MAILRWILFLIINITLVYAQDFTSATNAFHSTVSQISPTQISVQFKVANGYNIYQDKIKIVNAVNSNVHLGKMQLPQAIQKHNQALGDYMVYDNDFEVILPITKLDNGHLIIKVAYQGCKANSFCLPPVKYTKALNLITNAKLIPKQVIAYSKKDLSLADFNSAEQNSKLDSNVNPDKNHENNTITLLLNSHNSNDIARLFNENYAFIIVGFFIIGLLISFTPCIFPMLPILLSIVIGKELSMRRTVILSSSYIFGSSVSYAIAGVIAAKFGNNIQGMLQNIWLNGIIAAIFVVFSLSLFGLFELQLPSRIQKYFTREIGKKHSVVGVFLTGAISTLILSPCVTAPLAGVLLYVGSNGDVILGGSALFAMGLGSGLPLLLIATFGNSILPKNGAWMLRIKHVLGFIMLAMGVYLSSRFISDFWAYILASVWLISFGIFVFYLQKPKQRLFFITTLLAVIICGAGIGLLGQRIMYAINPKVNINKINSTTVNNVSELEIALQNAKSYGKPIIIDYSASWCSSCKEMELTTFTDKRVIELLNDKFTFITADISNNNTTSKTLMKKYEVFAPPTLIFLRANGAIDNSNTVVGYISAEKLIPILK